MLKDGEYIQKYRTTRQPSLIFPTNKANRFQNSHNQLHQQSTQLNSCLTCFSGTNLNRNRDDDKVNPDHLRFCL